MLLALFTVFNSFSLVDQQTGYKTPVKDISLHLDLCLYKNDKKKVLQKRSLMIEKLVQYDDRGFEPNLRYTMSEEINFRRLSATAV